MLDNVPFFRVVLACPVWLLTPWKVYSRGLLLFFFFHCLFLCFFVKSMFMKLDFTEFSCLLYFKQFSSSVSTVMYPRSNILLATELLSLKIPCVAISFCSSCELKHTWKGKAPALWSAWLLLQIQYLCIVWDKCDLFL